MKLTIEICYTHKYIRESCDGIHLLSTISTHSVASLCCIMGNNELMWSLWKDQSTLANKRDWSEKGTENKMWIVALRNEGPGLVFCLHEKKHELLLTINNNNSKTAFKDVMQLYFIKNLSTPEIKSKHKTVTPLQWYTSCKG